MRFLVPAAIAMATLLFACDQQRHNAVPRIKISRISSVRASIAVAVAWSKDGSLLAIASDYGQTMTIWNRKSRTTKTIIHTDSGPALNKSIEFLSNPDRILFTSGDNEPDARLTLWNIETSKISKNIGSGKSGEDYFTVSPIDHSLAIVSGGPDLIHHKPNVLLIYRSADDLDPEAIPLGRSVYSMTASGRAPEFVMGSDGVVAISDRTKKTFRDYSIFPDVGPMKYTVGAVATDPTSMDVFAGEGISSIWGPSRPSFSELEKMKGPPVKIFDASSGKIVASSKVPHAPIRKAVWDPLGRYVAFIDNHMELFVWRKAPGGFDLAQAHLDSPGFSLDVSPTGQQIAVATNSGVSIFEISNFR